MDPLLELNDLTAADFAPATSGEKEDFIQQRKSVSYWADAWRRLRKNVVAMVALGVIVLLVLFAFVGPMLVPYGYDQFNAGAENLYPWHYSLEAQQAYKEATSSQDPDEAVAAAEAEAAARGEELSSKDKALIRAQAKAGGGAEYEGMSEEEIYKALGYSAQPFGYSNDELQRIADGEKVFPHVFGTDRYGRDIMVRTMFATRVSMIIGLTAALIVLVIGALYGSISGFFGGTVDVVMQRIVDVIYSLPDVLIILLIATAMGPHVTQFITDHQGFFLAEFFKKVGPNLMGMFIAFACLYWVGMSRIIQIVATTCLQIPSAIFTESFMSFLGVGVLAPLTSLGSMCSDALGGISTYPYRLIIPAIIISIMILSFNLFGEGLRDALDPRLKK